jgi:hypothetical protein
MKKEILRQHIQKTKDSHYTLHYTLSRICAKEYDITVTLTLSTSRSRSLGACHADELALQFKLEDMNAIKPGDKDYIISKDFVKLWTSFAKNE